MKNTSPITPQELADAIRIKLHLFENCVTDWLQELTQDMETLEAEMQGVEISEISEISTLRNVKIFPTNGRKPKVLKSDFPPAA